MTAFKVVVDGSNIATEGRTMPSLTQLDEAVRALIEEYPAAEVVVIVDSTFAHRIAASERPLYEDAYNSSEIITPPAGTIGRGDSFILKVADKIHATVFSNDSFQEFHGTYDWLFQKGRLIGGKPIPGFGWVFADRTPVKGPRSREAVREARRTQVRIGSPEAMRPMPVPSVPPPFVTRDEAELDDEELKRIQKDARRVEKAAKQEAKLAKVVAEEARAERKKRKRRTGTRIDTGLQINDAGPFLRFISEHPIGGVVEAEVESYSSHGFYVVVGGARCYVPLVGVAQPAPRSAKEVVRRGENREFIVRGFDAPRRGIELAIPGSPAALDLMLSGSGDDEEDGDEFDRADFDRADFDRADFDRADSDSDRADVAESSDEVAAASGAVLGVAVGTSTPGSGGEESKPVSKRGTRRSKTIATKGEVPPSGPVVAAASAEALSSGSSPDEAPTYRRRSGAAKSVAVAGDASPRRRGRARQQQGGVGEETSKNSATQQPAAERSGAKKPPRQSSGASTKLSTPQDATPASVQSATVRSSKRATPGSSTAASVVPSRSQPNTAPATEPAPPVARTPTPAAGVAAREVARPKQGKASKPTPTKRLVPTEFASEGTAVSREVAPAAEKVSAEKVSAEKVSARKVSPKKVSARKVSPKKVPAAKPTTTEAVPSKAAPTKVAPTKVAPTKADPTKAAPTKAAPTQTGPAEQVAAAKDSSSPPTKAALTKAAPTKAAPTQTGPAERVAAAKDASSPPTKKRSATPGVAAAKKGVAKKVAPPR